MLTSDFLQFFYELSQNNNRDWFEKNKKRYENVVKGPWEKTIDALIERLWVIEPDFHITAKDCIMRIYRDTRFSADKTPYKTNTAAIISRTGRKNMEYPGYYLHLEFGNLMIGGGAYFLEKESLHKVRTAIMQNPSHFMSLLEAPDFVAKYGGIKGDLNKVLPQEFKEAAKTTPILANKQFYYMAELDPELAIGPGFVDLAFEYCKAAKPLNDFLREAMMQ